MNISYRAALQWILDNDDTEWLYEPEGIESVTACMVADLFGKTTAIVTRDLVKRVGN